MDIVVTIPKSFGLTRWIDEGDPAGTPEWSGTEWHFFLAGGRPDIEPGERVYCVFNGTLRGYAPLVRIDHYGYSYGLVRHSGAVAVTVPRFIQGFRGFRYRRWDYEEEVPFPAWQDPKQFFMKPEEWEQLKSRV